MKLILSILFALVSTEVTLASTCDCEGETGERWVNYRHRNPRTGGCVGPGTFVSENTFISKDSKVCGGARVKGNSIIIGGSIVTGTARVVSTEVFNGAYITEGRFKNEEVDGNQKRTEVSEFSIKQDIEESFSELKKLLTNDGKLEISTIKKSDLISSTSGRFSFDCEDYTGTYWYDDNWCRIEVKEFKRIKSVELNNCELYTTYDYFGKAYGRAGVLDTKTSDTYGASIDFKTEKFSDYKKKFYSDTTQLSHRGTGDTSRATQVGTINISDYYIDLYWKHLENIAKSCNKIHIK